MVVTRVYTCACKRASCVLTNSHCRFPYIPWCLLSLYALRIPKVVIATAGPFVKYTDYVVEACAKFGTHYVDICGGKRFKSVRVMEEGGRGVGGRLYAASARPMVPTTLTARALLSDTLHQKFLGCDR